MIRPLHHRRGFTLVEMLVTFSIIAVLGSLIAAGIMSWMSSQARRNTETTIRTLHSALLQHYDAVVTAAKKETVPGTVVSYADNDANRARVIWIKMRLMEAFPVNYNEIKNAYTALPLSNIPQDRRFYMYGYQKQIPSGPVATPGKTEAAACLLIALGTNHNGVSHTADLFRAFTADTNNDNVLEFVDGWQEPLRFHRFTTGNTALQNSKPSILTGTNLDPLDPKGLLYSWPTSANSTNFNNQVHVRSTGSAAWYAVPAIVSSGANLQMGLSAITAAPYQDMSVTSNKDAEDNIFSYAIK